MVKFIIYLVETGICITLLYLAYWLFLRKETYFDFNRFYLTGSMFLALVVPLIHVNLMIPEGSTWKDPAMGIVKFRSYYHELILMTNADFGTEPGQRHVKQPGYNVTADPDEMGELPVGFDKDNPAGIPDKYYDRSENRMGWKGIPVSALLIIIYAGGVLYFMARFIYLVFRLTLLARKNRVSTQDGFRVVEIKEEISPFSFFRFLFINLAGFNDSELRDVLEHEKAHILQRHTLDHLFAHGLAIFQWFNPFAWQIRKALKSTHEYIADRHVLRLGHAPMDYQSLLLRQVIGYHTVELVNNFNLKSIKNRIAMMNKTRSGLGARIKAIMLIPAAFAVFFLSANFTWSETERNEDVAQDIAGLWINQNKENFSRMIFIEDGRFSFIDGTSVREYHWRADKNSLILSDFEGTEGIPLKFKIRGDEMDLWWNDSHRSIYSKSAAQNSMDYFLEQLDEKIQLPYISQYRLMEGENLIFKIAIGFDSQHRPVLSYNGKRIDRDELKTYVIKEKNKLSKIDQGALTAMFFVDREMPMEEVVNVRDQLRDINSLHIADAGYPHGEFQISPLLYHQVGFPRLIPPKDAKTLDKDEMKKSSIPLLEIDLSARNTTPRDLDLMLDQFIGSSEKEGKYVISLAYDSKIPYGQYIETVDMVFKVIYKYRDQLAINRYQIPYSKLGDEVQQEIRKIYPIPLSEQYIPD